MNFLEKYIYFYLLIFISIFCLKIGLMKKNTKKHKYKTQNIKKHKLCFVFFFVFLYFEFFYLCVFLCFNVVGLKNKKLHQIYLFIN